MLDDYRKTHLSKEKARRYDEEIYKKGLYDDFLWQWEQGILTRELELLQKRKEKINYLDFACGTGRIASFIEDGVDNSQGIDISQEMIALAREKVSITNFIVGDITRKDILRGQKFDLITAFRFFLNAQPQLKNEAMAALQKLLKDNNSILIFNIHGNKCSHRFITYLYFKLKGRQLNIYSFWQARKLIKKHNLEIVHSYGFGFLPKICYRVVGAKTSFTIDRALYKIPILKFFSYDLVFVCRKL